MGLYRLQESNNLDTETLVEFFLSEETTAELERQVEYDEQKLVAYTKSLEDNEKELKKLIESKPRSWLERKLISFHKAIKRFEAKYVYAKDGKTKGIIGKILSILTRIVKFINDKLLKLTKYVGNKFFNRQEKLKDHHNKILDKKEENRMHRLDIDSTKKSLEINRNRLVDSKKSDSETSKLFDTNISKEERQKIMDKLKAKMDKESKRITDNMLRNK